MINAYMASPKRFNQIDFDKIGSGTGVLRYAFGVYMGEKNTAQKYYNDYEHCGMADKKFYREGKEIKEGSVAHQIASDLADNKWDIEGIKKHYEIYGEDNKFIKALKLLTDDFSKIDFKAEYAVLYEVNLPGYDQSDLPHWDNEMSNEQLNEIAFLFYNNQISVENLPEKLMTQLEGLEVDIQVEDAEELIDNIFDAAYEYAQEEDLIGYHVEEDLLKEVWYQKMRGDNYSSHMFEDEFNEAIDQKYIDALESVIKGGISLESTMSFGDMYHQLSHALNDEYQDPEKNIKGKQLASKFLSEKSDFIGFVADSMFGDKGAQEIIIINEKVAQSIKLKERSLEDENDDDFSFL